MIEVIRIKRAKEEICISSRRIVSCGARPLLGLLPMDSGGLRMRAVNHMAPQCESASTARPDHLSGLPIDMAFAPSRPSIWAIVSGARGKPVATLGPLVGQAGARWRQAGAGQARAGALARRHEPGRGAGLSARSAHSQTGRPAARLPAQRHQKTSHTRQVSSLAPTQRQDAPERAGPKAPSSTRAPPWAQWAPAEPPRSGSARRKTPANELSSERPRAANLVIVCRLLAGAQPAGPERRR